MGAYAVQPVTLVDVSANSVGAATHEGVVADPHRHVVSGKDARVAEVESFRSANQGLVVDVADYDRVTLQLTNWPVDEFVYLLEGTVELTDSKGIKRVYGPTDAFVMPKGFSGTWTQPSSVKYVAVTHRSPSSRPPAARGVGVKTKPVSIVPIGSSILDRMKKRMTVLESWEPYLKVRQGEPTRYLEVPLYASSDQQFKVQAERFEAVDIDLLEWPIDELFHIVHGQLVLDVGDGTTRVFGPGDTFVMPKGFSGHWHETDTVDLITADYEDGGTP